LPQGPTATPTAAPAAGRTAVIPASLANKCSATTQFKNLFGEAAQREPFDVYCAVLPSDYWVENAIYQLPDGGFVDASYTNPRGFAVMFEEGNLCPEGIHYCEFGSAPVGRIWLGDMGADLYAHRIRVALVGPTTNIYMAFAYVGPGKVYGFLGVGMSQATFVKLAAAVVKVPRS
jgi:hypothetical protein